MSSTQALDWTQSRTWYDTHADDFEMATLNLGISPLLEEFAAMLAPQARVLDAGCGVGRDTRWLIDRGFAVDAFDISGEMVRATRDNTNGRVAPRQIDFRDYADPPGSWDGIWALASLLHLPKTEIADSMARLCTSLTQTGILAFSVKAGEGERMDSLGRPMAFYAPDEITAIAARALGSAGEVRSAVARAPSSEGCTSWINVFAMRKAATSPSPF